MESTCRACLVKCSESRSLFTTLKVANNRVCIADILTTFFNYEASPNDGLPQKNSLVKLYQSNTDTESNDEQPNQEDSEYEEKPNIDEIKISNKDCCNLNDRTYAVSQQETVLYCVECRDQFNSVKTLLQHCHKHHKPKRKTGRRCDFCNENFEDFKSLISHRKHHLFLYVCEVCWLGFSLENELQQHKCEKPIEKENNESDKKMSQCDQCGKSYPMGYIKLHMRIHGSETFYKCDYCPKKFKVRCSLNSHILWNHKKMRNHKCDICGAAFVTASAKMTHYRKIHLLEKKHACDSCGKKFFSKSEMQRHMLTHTGEKNFQCHLCEKSYQTRYGLNVHLKSHSINVHA